MRTYKKSKIEIEKLLPCPFCGAESELFDRTCYEFDNQESDEIYDIRCNTKGCFMEEGSDWYEDKDKIIEMWNKRVKSHS